MNIDKALNFIESYFVTTIEPDDTRLYHIDEAEWKSVKSRILKLEPQPDEDRLMSPEEMRGLQVTIGDDWNGEQLYFAALKAAAKAQLAKDMIHEQAEIEKAVKAERERITGLMNMRDVGGIEPEWALSDRVYQALSNE